MIITKPYYYDSFKCTADKCRDSCCIGWEIDIDKDSLLLYTNEKGELGAKLSQSIKDGSFTLTLDERCPFLESNGLCELICKKGEGYICEICREHPRYHEWYGNRHDMGLGLCCEEACRLLFCNEAPLTFISEDDGSPAEEDDEEIRSLLCLREQIYKILYNRDIPLPQRFKRFSFKPLTLSEILTIWDSLEPFDQRWTSTVKQIKENISLLISKKDDFIASLGKRIYEYEHLAIYLTHRYFMKSNCRYFADSVLRGIAIYLETQFLFDLYTYNEKGSFELSDRIDTAKYISKQLEYSEENIDIIMNT